MCGIVGLIDTIEGRVAPQLLESMRDAMIARGPDDTGDYFDEPVGMAMRRLFIIDIETGSQLVLLVEWYKSFTRRKREAASEYEETAATSGY